MRRILLLLIMIIGLLIGLMVFMPLASVLKLAGAEQRGLSWTAVDGTLMGGDVRGLRAGDDLLGDAAVTLQPGTLLRLGVEYAFDWSGPAGSGRGKAAVFPGGDVEISDYDIRFNFASLEGLALWIRQSGGEAGLTGPMIRFKDGICDRAEGRTWSDALTRNEALLGHGWPEMTGNVACVGPDLAIPFAAQSAAGTQVDTLVRFSFRRPGTMEARISGFIPQDFQYALPIAGFMPDGGAFVYYYPAPMSELAP